MQSSSEAAYIKKFREWTDRIPVPSKYYEKTAGGIDGEIIRSVSHSEFKEYILYILDKLIPNDKDHVIADTMADIAKNIFKKAFNHESYHSENNYQSFEMVGDNILKCYFSLYLQSIKPDITPDTLTSTQRYYMSKTFQPKIARDFKMDKWVSGLESSVSDASVHEDVFEAFMGALHMAATETRKHFLVKYEEDGDVRDAIRATKTNPDIIVTNFIRNYFRTIPEKELFSRFVKKTLMFEYRSILAFTKDEKPFDEFKRVEEDEATGTKYVKWYVSISNTFITRWYRLVGKSFTFGKDIPIKYEGTDPEEIYTEIYNNFYDLGFGKEWLENQRSHSSILANNPIFKRYMEEKEFKKVLVQFLPNLSGFKCVIHLFDIDGNTTVFTSQGNTKNGAIDNFVHSLKF